MRLNKNNLFDGTFDFVDKGELSELFLDHVLEYTNALNLYTQAVELGGTLEVTATDFDSIVDKYSRHIFYLDKINEYLGGERKFMVTLERTLKDLTGLGFQVLNKRIDQETSEFYIKCVRVK